ncbi:MAG TPA: HD domain-containing phosphohydrolase [Tepidisphaeraceae bacterium]|jgi:putative two-component system response regulator
MRILIADDDPIALEMLRHALTRAGYEVETASNGIEAMEIVARGACRLVISDWTMPEMDGLELCRRIRNSDAGGYIYLILLTARNSSNDTIEGLSAGADDLIPKPFNPPELLLRVQIGERILSLETRDVTIFALAKLAESRDPETGAHLERVCNYSRLLAQYLATRGTFGEEINSGYVRLIFQTSPLHDIGKVAIPDCVLLKPGRLSDREFEIMKSHTTLGAQTLDAALRQHPEARFLRMARNIAATHHERFDGTGYPAGLKGRDIPLCGRIVSVADVYDALTTKRVYKNAFAHDVAKAMIIDERGTHFDPEIVDAFLACEQQFLDIRERYADQYLQAA